jgi:hypothetical protein
MMMTSLETLKIPSPSTLNYSGKVSQWILAQRGWV